MTDTGSISRPIPKNAYLIPPSRRWWLRSHGQGEQVKVIIVPDDRAPTSKTIVLHVKGRNAMEFREREAPRQKPPVPPKPPPLRPPVPPQRKLSLDISQLVQEGVSNVGQLNTRQKHYLKLCGQGMSNTHIATEMTSTPGSVSVAMAHIYATLGIGHLPKITKRPTAMAIAKAYFNK